LGSGMEGGRRMGCRMEGCPTLDTSPFLNGATEYPSCQVTGPIQVCCRIPDPGARRDGKAQRCSKQAQRYLLWARRLCVIMATQIAGAGSVAGFATAVTMLVRAMLPYPTHRRCRSFTRRGFSHHFRVGVRRHSGQLVKEGDNAP